MGENNIAALVVRLMPERNWVKHVAHSGDYDNMPAQAKSDLPYKEQKRNLDYRGRHHDPDN